MFFPNETKPLLTPFKEDFLHFVYDVAQEFLGESLESVSVSVRHDYDVPGSSTLVLGLVATIGQKEFSDTHRAIAEAVAEYASGWTESEMSEYREGIHYEVVPLNV